MNDLEHGALVGAICDASQDGLNAAAKAQRKRDLIDIIREFSPRISTLICEAVAEELETQSTFFWESATGLEPTQKVLSENAEEGAAAILDVHVRLWREVASRLRRRAASVRGISADELAMRGVLLLPAEPSAAEEAPEPGKEGESDGPSVE